MNKTINITSGDAEVCSCTEEDIKKYCLTVSNENACEKFFSLQIYERKFCLDHQFQSLLML